VGAVGAIFVKELKIEFRNKQVINLYLILTVLILAAFRFAFEVTATAVDDLASPVLWITLFFCGVFSMNPVYKRELDGQTRDGLLLAPIDGSSIFVGKLMANLLVVFLMELVAVVLFFAFFAVDAPSNVPAFVLVLLLGTFGFVVMGNIISAMSSSLAQSELMLPVLLVPILLFTIVVSAVSATAEVFEGGDIGDVMDESRIMAAFSLIYFVAGYLLVEHILEA
jgi:heme exporter protein B